MQAELKIFIAGSKFLERERAIIRNVSSNLVTEYERRGRKVALTVYSFDNFGLTFTKEGQQQEYNKFIRNQADIVIFVCDGTVKGITIDEFNVAYSTYSKKKRPLICVLSKKYDTVDEKIESIRQRVSSLNQYYNEYQSEIELERLVEKLLRECVESKLIKSQSSKTVKRLSFLAFLAAVLVGLFLYFGKGHKTQIEPIVVESKVKTESVKDNPSESSVPAEKPIAKPVAKPVEQPVVKPVEQPVVENEVPTLESLAESGNPESCYQLAYNYQNGVNGYSKNLTSAFVYMKKAADFGYIKAFRPLAEMYHSGRGVAKDRSQAEYWYRKAADNGDKRALQILNNM